MKNLLALLLLSTTSVFGQQTAGTVDPSTGNIVYTTVNPPPQGADQFTWSGFGTTYSNGGGYSGGYQPAWNPTTGTFMFGYNQGTVSYTTPVNFALSQAGTGIQVTGLKYSWEYLNQDYNRGTLSGKISLTSNIGEALQSYTYNMPYTTNGWTTMSGRETFNTQYAPSSLGTLSVSFTGKDDRWWAGYYGPQVRAIDVGLTYSVAAPPPTPTDFLRWIPLVNENDTFTLTTAGVVRYGGQGVYDYKSFSAGTHECSNHAWGNDPIGGVYKSCSLGSNTAVTTTTPTVPKTTTTTTTDYSTVALLDPVTTTTTNTTSTTTVVTDPIVATTPTATTSSPTSSQPSAVTIVSAPAPAPTTSSSSTSTTSTTTQSSTKESSQSSGGSTSLALSIISKNSDRDAAGAAIAQSAVAQAQAAANQAQQEAQTVASNAVSNSVSAGQSAMKSESNGGSSRTGSSSSSQVDNLAQNAGQINLVLGPTINSNTNSSTQKQEQTTNNVAMVSQTQSNTTTQTIQATVVNNDSNKSATTDTVTTTSTNTLLPPQQTFVATLSPIPTQVLSSSLSSVVQEQQAQTTSIYSLVPPQQPVLQLVVPTTTNVETLQQPVVAQQQSTQTTNMNESVAILPPNFLTDRSNPLTDIVEGKNIVPQNSTIAMTGPVVNKNAQDNEVAGGVDLNKMATSPTGYSSYLNLVLRDVAFYAPKEVYKNQKNVDNARALRQLSSDRLHQEMVEQQYKGN